MKNIQEILDAHKKWLNGEEGGQRASLCNADLRYANLCDASLRYAGLDGADLRYADLCDADLHGADLSHTDLFGVNLRGADLRGANLDYACLPLWCGSLNIKIDKRLAAQIAYHFCAMQCDDPQVKEIQKSLYAFANTFHHVGEVPRLGE